MIKVTGNARNLKPLKLVVNAGNGATGHMVNVIEERLDIGLMETKTAEVLSLLLEKL